MIVYSHGPMPGSNYQGEYAEESLALSILQHELSRLGVGVKTEMAPTIC